MALTRHGGGCLRERGGRGRAEAALRLASPSQFWSHFSRGQFSGHLLNAVTCLILLDDEDAQLNETPPPALNTHSNGMNKCSHIDRED